jgi:hypothetical protein
VRIITASDSRVMEVPLVGNSYNGGETYPMGDFVIF